MPFIPVFGDRQQRHSAPTLPNRRGLPPEKGMGQAQDDAKLRMVGYLKDHRLRRGPRCVSVGKSACCLATQVTGTRDRHSPSHSIIAWNSRPKDWRITSGFKLAAAQYIIPRHSGWRYSVNGDTHPE